MLLVQCVVVGVCSMPCFHPLKAMRSTDGVKILRPDAPLFNLRIPCGQCVGCRLERSRQWAVRCMHEASCHTENSFVTLTYDEEHLPRDRSLDYDVFQRFMKRLRKAYLDRVIKFYMCGEYGETYARPHFHAILFGIDWPDKQVFSVRDGVRLYTSEALARLWPNGFSSIGDVTFESCAYVARYVMKKVTGDAAAAHYRMVDTETGELYDRKPEFNRMSLKPGIGGTWFSRFHTDVFPHDYVVSRGVKCKPPKYYDRLYHRLDNEAAEAVKEKRVLDSAERWEDNTRARLEVKEVVTKARISKLKRSI